MKCQSQSGTFADPGSYSGSTSTAPSSSKPTHNAAAAKGVSFGVAAVGVLAFAL